MTSPPSEHAPVRRIDAHQHFWNYRASEYPWIDDSMTQLRRDFLPADLQPVLTAAKCDACVAVQARQSLDETHALLNFADQHSFIAGVVGWVDLQSDELDAQLDRFAFHSKLVGVRHVVQDEPDDRFLLSPAFLKGIGRLADVDLAYDILVYRKHLSVVTEFVSRFPAQRFVLDHLGKPDVKGGDLQKWTRDLRRIAAHPHVFAKLSGLVTEADWQTWTPDEITPYLEVAFECFGPDRLMIGSDWPVCTLAADYGRTMDVVTRYLEDRPRAEQTAILGGNAQLFYRLPA